MSNSLIIGSVNDQDGSRFLYTGFAALAVDDTNSFYFNPKINHKLFSNREFFLTNGNKVYDKFHRLSLEHKTIIDNIDLAGGLSNIDTVFIKPGTIRPYLPLVNGATYASNMSGNFDQRLLPPDERITDDDIFLLSKSPKLDLNIDLNATREVLSRVSQWANKTIYCDEDNSLRKYIVWLNGEFIGTNIDYLSKYSNELQLKITKQLERAEKAAMKAKKKQQRNAGLVRKLATTDLSLRSFHLI
ncbi:TPA: hypothetical protein ACX6RO_001826 [Photobacterium damselae]